MKIGILGTGMIVKALMKTIHLLEFESIYVLGTEQTKDETYSLAKTYGFDRCYFDYDEMLQGDADTIYVALPNHLHYSFSKKALENHKHVIIEKPITSNVSELVDLIQTAQQNHCIILEAMNIHYLPAYQSLKSDLSLIGETKIVSLNYSQYSSRYDSFKEGIILPAFDYKKAGGALMDINVYNIHFVVGLFGKPLKINYQANIQQGIDTSGILTMDYGSFKAVCIGAKDCSAPIISTIQGDKGSLMIQKPVNQMMSYEFSLIKQEPISYDFHENLHRLYYEFQAFIEIIDQRNFEKANEMLRISKIVSEIMQEARWQEGVRFSNE